MSGKKLRQGLVAGSELILAVVLSAVSFLALMGILNLSFPKGTGLNEFLRSKLNRNGGASVGQSAKGEESGSSEAIALVTEVTRDVKHRSSSAIVWALAEVGMPVADRHTIQTLARSGASISFNNRGQLQLGENSLVVIKRSGRRGSGGEEQASLVVLGGQVRGRMSAKSGSSPLKLVTASTSTEIRPDGESPAEFNLTVNPDSSSTLSVYSGAAAITSEGRTAMVLPNQSITVLPDQPPGEPEPIPDAPRPLAPVNGEQLLYAATAPAVRFRWSGDEKTQSYEFQIAEDPAFESPLFAKRLADSSFVHGNLDAGSYYWRVRGIHGSQAGQFGPTQLVRLIQDRAPPSITVSLPEEIVTVDRIMIRGATDPGAMVTIGETAVPIRDDGAFEYAMQLRPGPNIVVIEAVDEAGNVAYHSQYVHAKF